MRLFHENHLTPDAPSLDAIASLELNASASQLECLRLQGDFVVSVPWMFCLLTKLGSQRPIEITFVLMCYRDDYVMLEPWSQLDGVLHPAAYPSLWKVAIIPKLTEPHAVLNKRSGSSETFCTSFKGLLPGLTTRGILSVTPEL